MNFLGQSFQKLKNEQNRQTDVSERIMNVWPCSIYGWWESYNIWQKMKRLLP